MKLCAVRPMRGLSLTSEGECKPHLSRANGIKPGFCSPNLLCFVVMQETLICVTEKGIFIV